MERYLTFSKSGLDKQAIRIYTPVPMSIMLSEGDIISGWSDIQLIIRSPTNMEGWKVWKFQNENMEGIFSCKI